MPSSDHIANSEILIDAPIEKVWDALVNPEVIKKYMFGTTVISDWTEGSKIFWQGEWKGKTYEDKGTILKIIPGRQLQYSHFSPLTGLEDSPENYHTVTIGLRESNNQTLVSLSQENNATEKEKEHSESNWKMMLTGLKELLEKTN
ncbi:MAG TPA: SRPBCC domain-containing protein [Flavipsychrobacter sp.]|nr:SRPBCC domain-containing protein [Flavipsychrobacter sp.]